MRAGRRPGAGAIRPAFAGCFLGVALLAAGPAPARAHGEPISYASLFVKERGIDAVVEAPAIDLAHDLPDVEADTLLSPAGIANCGRVAAGNVAARMVLSAEGNSLHAAFTGAEAVPDKKSLKLRLHYPLNGPAKSLRVRCVLFPYDPRHKTYLNVYDAGRLERQRILDAAHPTTDCALGRRQALRAVVVQFVLEGIHHIFIGPDHILFIVGLLLLGGTVWQLLKITTAFTVAHSITLALATLNILTPPSRVTEPAIALSIVFVGLHSLRVPKEKRDYRLLFAFCFGLIHGFGFASVLKELELPRNILGWSLFSFNAGVELGQMCIVLTVAPALALLRARSDRMAAKVVVAGSLLVTLAGAFWFVQRIIT